MSGDADLQRWHIYVTHVDEDSHFMTFPCACLLVWNPIREKAQKLVLTSFWSNAFGWTASGEFAVQRCKSGINTTCRAQEVGGKVPAQVCSWCDSVWHHCRRLSRHRLLTLYSLYELEAEPSYTCFCFGRGDNSRAVNENLLVLYIDSFLLYSFTVL